MPRKAPPYDTGVANAAEKARFASVRLGKEPEKIFGSYFKDLPRASSRTGLPAITEAELFGSSDGAKAQSFPTHHFQQRVDLEQALIALDDCYSASEQKPREPLEGDLNRLTKAIDALDAHIGKRHPSLHWGKCEKLDRHFPKLRLRERITGFLDRYYQSTPRRPYNQLVGLPGSQQFFETVIAIHRGNVDYATVDWQAHRELLRIYRRLPNPKEKDPEKGTALLGSAGELVRGKCSLSGSPATLVAFLELDRDDLHWVIRFQKSFWMLAEWVIDLQNPKLLNFLTPFHAGSIDYVKIRQEMLVALPQIMARTKNAARKAKSRKRVGKKA